MTRRLAAFSAVAAAAPASASPREDLLGGQGQGCTFGEGDGCDALAEGNELILVASGYQISTNLKLWDSVTQLSLA